MPVVTANRDPHGWGYNIYGMVGDNSIVNREIPRHLLPDLKFIQIFAGQFHSGALSERMSSSVYTYNTDFDAEHNLHLWGKNDYGELLHGSPSGYLAPWDTGIFF